MVLSKISEIGGVIQGSYNDETIVPMIADSAAQAGMVVGALAAGIIDGVETTNDTVVGIMLEHYATDMDTAVASPKVVSVVIPKSGHLYGILCDDLNKTTFGWGLIVGANAGLLAPATDVVAENVLATIWQYTDDDTVCIVRWVA